MGYLPPLPPGPIPRQFGTSPFHSIEVTTLSDENRVFIAGQESARWRDDFEQRHAEIAHSVKMAEIHRQTMREARIGQLLLVALVLSVIACIAQWTGLL